MRSVSTQILIPPFHLPSGKGERREGTIELVRITKVGTVSSQNMFDLLRRIAKPGLTSPVTLVLDNARYQHCEMVMNLAGQPGITLPFQPSYSQNLAPYWTL